jgi:hypothetical protein
LSWRTAGILSLEIGAVINVAEGGTVSIVPGVTPGTYDEVHIFRADNTPPADPAGQATHSLIFNNPTRPAEARVLVVGGSDGGGAGRFVYHPAFKLGAGENWDTFDTISVKVGAGGLGGNGGVVKGNNGGNSEVVRYTGVSPDYQIIAPGGGGAGGGDGNNNSQWVGKDGGSGGGSHNSAALSSAIPDYGTGGGRYIGGGAMGYAGEGSIIDRASDISGVSRTYAGGPGTYSDGGDGTGNAGNCGRNGARASNGASGTVIFRFTYPWPYTP